MNTPLLVLVTFPDRGVADRVLGMLVDERLIACGTRVSDAESVYRWQGRVERAVEVLALMKTAPERWETLRSRLRELHPYEVPEMIGFQSLVADADYAAWVQETTRPET